MSIQNDLLSMPRQGPTVMGETTSVSIFSITQLKESGFLPGLQQTVNTAFGVEQRLQGITTDRLPTVDSFIEHMRNDPETFVIIVHPPGASNVIGTASCRRRREVDRQSPSPWVRKIDLEKGSVEWELKLVAVDLKYQRQGLAKYMMDLVEQEVITRSAAQITSADSKDAVIKVDEDEAPNPTKIKMVLSANREINGKYYQRAGYILDDEIPRFDFHIAFMSKYLGA